LHYFREHGFTFWHMVEIKRKALYGKLSQFVRSGQIKKEGILCYVSDGEKFGGILVFPSSFCGHFFHGIRTDAESSMNEEGYRRTSVRGKFRPLHPPMIVQCGVFR
jgi:hypothetical protein